MRTARPSSPCASRPTRSATRGATRASRTPAGCRSACRCSAGPGRRLDRATARPAHPTAIRRAREVSCRFTGRWPPPGSRSVHSPLHDDGVAAAASGRAPPRWGASPPCRGGHRDPGHRATVCASCATRNPSSARPARPSRSSSRRPSAAPGTTAPTARCIGGRRTGSGRSRSWSRRSGSPGASADPRSGASSSPTATRSRWSSATGSRSSSRAARPSRACGASAPTRRP